MVDPGVDPSAVPAIVYTWVNGSDPAVIAACASVGGSCKGSSRTNADRNELKYSLRSIEKYAPWFNGLVVIISNEIPPWIDVNHPRLKIVPHTELYPPERQQCLPTFNSISIEGEMVRLQDAVEGFPDQFLYFNDDVFLGDDVSPWHLTKQPMWNDNKIHGGYNDYSTFKKTNKRLWLASVYYTNYLFSRIDVEERVPRRFLHHGPVYFDMDRLRRVWEYWPTELEETACHHFRKHNSAQIHWLHNMLWELEEGPFPNTPKEEAVFLKIGRSFLFATDSKLPQTPIPKIYNLNDAGTTPDINRRVISWLEEQYPDKSSFEK